MRLLVLGGTRFLGRALVESALARGHELTLFNRGQTNAELFPETEKIRGDRTLDLSPLDGREWDAVLDVATFLPRAVRRSVEALAGRVGRYVYVSSISAYADQSTPPVEGAPVAELDDRDAEDVEHYGALKAACEQIVVDAFGERRARRPTGADRRAARSDRPLHVLAATRGRGRPRARACPSRPAGAVHRRSRPRRLDRLGDRGATRRPLQRDRRHDLLRAAARRVPTGLGRRGDRLGAVRAARGSPASASGWSSRSGSSRRSTRRRTAPTCRRRSGRGSASGRWPRRSRTRSRGTPSARFLVRRASGSRPSGSGSCWPMPERDYSATPLSKKLGAKPGAAVVVFFTTSSGRPREALRQAQATARPSGRALGRLAEEGVEARDRPRLRDRAADRPRRGARRQQERRRWTPTGRPCASCTGSATAS